MLVVIGAPGTIPVVKSSSKPSGSSPVAEKAYWGAGRL